MPLRDAHGQLCQDSCSLALSVFCPVSSSEKVGGLGVTLGAQDMLLGETGPLKHGGGKYRTEEQATWHRVCT